MHFVGVFYSFTTSVSQSTEARRNAYRAIVHARPPHLNNIYLATQVFIIPFLSEVELNRGLL